MGGSSASQSLLFRDRALGGRQRLEPPVGDRLAALHGQPVRPGGQPRLGALDGGELLLEVRRATRVELLLVEVLRAAILGLVAVAGGLGAELGDLQLDPLALGGEELVGAVGVHRATLPMGRSAMDTRGHGRHRDPPTRASSASSRRWPPTPRSRQRRAIAAALTGSPALLAETLHTIADAGNEVLLYVAIRRSRHPPDATHPFGYGPERYYWALLAAIGMFLVGGAVSIWDGIRALCTPRARGVLGRRRGPRRGHRPRRAQPRRRAAALRVQAARREVTVRELLRESPDPTVVTVYLEDTIDVLGAVLALLALVLHRVTGSAVADALASIVIGGLLCFIASRLTRRNRQLLTNQAVPERYVAQLRARLETEAEISAVTNMEAVYLGPGEVLVAADVAMADGLSGAGVALALARTRAAICNELPVVARLYLTPVEPDP